MAAAAWKEDSIGGQMATQISVDIIIAGVAGKRLTYDGLIQ
jgi:hypothetical protein